MMKKITLYIFLVLLSAGSTFGQTNKELLKLGDAAMVNGQYTNAVHYYAFILFKIHSGDEAIYYPYEISPTYQEPEKQEDGTIAPPTNPDAKEIRVIHKLADAYRLADDYKHAEIWYVAALENPNEEFPYAQYFYGVSLMYNSKFEEAQTQFECFMSSNGDTDAQVFFNIYSRLWR